jgi:hypothetical protein
MIFLGLMFAGLVVRNSHLSDQGKNVDIQTPVGELKVNQNPNRGSGLPVYPGSTPSSEDGHANLADGRLSRSSDCVVFAALGIELHARNQRPRR